MHNYNQPPLSLRKSNQHSPTGPMAQTMTRIVQGTNHQQSPQSTQHMKESMKSYFSNPNIHNGPNNIAVTSCINVASSH